MPRREYAHIRLEAPERQECESEALRANLSLSDYLRLRLGYLAIGKRDKRSGSLK